jgi:hypothetical protein
MYDNLVLLFIAVLQTIAAYLTWRTHNVTVGMQVNVQRIEHATNGMKDALVASTDAAARAEGTAAGLAQGRQE